MKTKVLAIALFVAASCTGAFAQQNDTKQCCKEKQEQCGKCKDKQGCPGEQPGCPGQPGEGPQQGCPGEQPKCPIMAALESVNLTDAQRTAIDNLGKERAEADKAKCEQARKDRAEADSVARAAQRQEKLDFLKSLKSILTADQYVSFLENSVINAQEAPRGEQSQMERAPRMKGPRGSEMGGFRPREDMPKFAPQDDNQEPNDCCKNSKKESKKDSKKKSKKD